MPEDVYTDPDIVQLTHSAKGSRELLLEYTAERTGRVRAGAGLVVDVTGLGGLFASVLINPGTDLTPPDRPGRDIFDDIE